MSGNFTTMVNEYVPHGRFLKGVTWGLIACILKEGDRSKLTNWRPIMLLNTTYKISAKALQRRLQPLLKEVIDSDQTAFLPLRFIFNNILLTHESIQWVKESCQKSIFFKLDFSKVCDRVKWALCFKSWGNQGCRTPLSNDSTVVLWCNSFTQYQQPNNWAF